MLKYHVISRKSPQSQEVKFYAQPNPVSPITLDTLGEIISNQSTVTIHDVKAVLSALQEQIFVQLRDGKSVRLGDLGSFRLTLHSVGAVSQEAFRSSNIMRSSVRFMPSSKLRWETAIRNPNMKLMLDGNGAPKSPEGEVVKQADSSPQSVTNEENLT